MPDEKKLIIDEDWKTQVEAERRQAQQGAQAAPPGLGAQGGSDDFGDLQMPPASLELLVTTLATEALLAMGHMPHPVTGKVQVQRNQAKYLIDTIDVLREKTKGNLTPDEQLMIDSVLHQLRMAFVASGT
ncbi:MAG: DUF1844 domain-containing protein [Pirellulales bacterium]